MKFLMQKIEGKIVHDFSFTLLQAIKYHKWLHKNSMTVKFIDCYDEMSKKYTPLKLQFKPYHYSYIPIGSVEFVNEFLFHFYHKELKPTNIPVELRAFDYTKRIVFDGNETDINNIDRHKYNPDYQWFVKSNDKIKQYSNFHKFGDNIPVGNYQYSNKIHIESEWRAFIYNGILVGLNNYAGEFTEFPNVEMIRWMINKYKSAPIAYTLDVGIDGNKTFVIEAHPFISCGLYGMCDLSILPNMFAKAFNEIISERL